jgi:hypothetical protein
VHPNEHLSEEDSQRHAYIAHDANGAWLVNEGIEDAQNLETRDAIARGQAIRIAPGLRTLVKRDPPAHLLWIDTLPHAESP